MKCRRRFVLAVDGRRDTFGTEDDEKLVRSLLYTAGEWGYRFTIREQYAKKNTERGGEVNRRETEQDTRFLQKN
ncbi:hypothetical protein PMZ84_05000 [[Clostridium] symbiosum]|nr:hypothetical protein [[Clostridium] symbiosum]